MTLLLLFRRSQQQAPPEEEPEPKEILGRRYIVNVPRIQRQKRKFKFEGKLDGQMVSKIVGRATGKLTLRWVATAIIERNSISLERLLATLAMTEDDPKEGGFYLALVLALMEKRMRTERDSK